jgi:hypothetical protein
MASFRFSLSQYFTHVTQLNGAPLVSLSLLCRQEAATPNQARTCQASTAPHRLALQRKPKSPNEAKPSQTKPDQTCSSSNSDVLPSPSHPNHHPHPRILEKALLHSLLRLRIPPLPSFDQLHPIPSTVIWIAYIKTNSIALDVHVPSWSINRINHLRVVSQVQPAADFTLPIAEVLQSSHLS